MSINIEASASSMPESLDLLKTTPLIMHRIYFVVQDIKTWYVLHSAAKNMFGKNYRSQKHVKKRIKRAWSTGINDHCVWFEVPTQEFGTWCAIKYAVRTSNTSGK